MKLIFQQKCSSHHVSVGIYIYICEQQLFPDFSARWTVMINLQQKTTTESLPMYILVIRDWRAIQFTIYLYMCAFMQSDIDLKVDCCIDNCRPPPRRYRHRRRASRRREDVAQVLKGMSEKEKYKFENYELWLLERSGDYTINNQKQFVFSFRHHCEQFLLASCMKYMERIGFMLEKIRNFTFNDVF
jgi:hypothetical protein